MTAVCVCVRMTERTTHHRHLSIFMYLSLLLLLLIDNIHFFNCNGIMRSFNLLNVLLKDVCNISDN